MRILLLIIIFISYSLYAGNCSQYPDESGYFNTEYFCNQNGFLVREVCFRTNTGEIRYERFYENDKMILSKSYFSESRDQMVMNLEHQADGSIIREIYYPNSSDYSEKVHAKDQYLPPDLDPRNGWIVHRHLKEWFFDKYNAYNRFQIDYYFYQNKTKLLKRRDLIEKSGNQKFIFTYPQENADYDYPSTVTAYDQEGELLYFFDPADFVLQDFWDEHQKINNDNVIAIIDSDFDIRHPLLSQNIYVSSTEVIDGIDNDNNGWIDDVFGWNQDRHSSNHLPSIQIRTYGEPVSHGTHVASIALSRFEEISFISYSGDLTDVSNMKLITKDINKKSIRFANMSFGAKYRDKDHRSGSEHYRFIVNFVNGVKNLIDNTPNTLHVIAAGNDGESIDNGKLVFYPAGFANKNILTIAALDTDKLVQERMAEYKLATFSNYGIYSVDIAAPGTSVDGAAPGGGMVRLSGTSMATPYTLGHGVLVASIANPNLTIFQIKEIIIKTAYVKDIENPFPVTSGGMLYPERIERTAKMMLENSLLSVHQAVLSIRKTEFDLLLEGENNSDEYLDKLVKLWRGRLVKKND